MTAISKATFGIEVATLRTWARRLRHFRFVAAIGGHANDADELTVAFRCSDLEDLCDLMRALDQPCSIYEAYPEQPVRARPYQGSEMARFVRVVGGPDERPIIEQPLHCHPHGVPMFARASRSPRGWLLWMSPIDEHRPYEITETCVARAERLEPWLGPVLDGIVDPPVDPDEPFFQEPPCPSFPAAPA